MTQCREMGRVESSKQVHCMAHFSNTSLVRFKTWIWPGRFEYCMNMERGKDLTYFDREFIFGDSRSLKHNNCLTGVLTQTDSDSLKLQSRANSSHLMTCMPKHYVLYGK